MECRVGGAGWALVVGVLILGGGGCWGVVVVFSWVFGRFCVLAFVSVLFCSVVILVCLVFCWSGFDWGV